MNGYRLCTAVGDKRRYAMLKKMNERIASHRAVILSLVGGAVIGLAQYADAFAPNIPSNNSGGEPCAYSLQLQRSVEARGAYMVKVEQLAGGAYPRDAVMEMYGNVVPASVRDEDEESDAADQRSVVALFKKLRKTPVAMPGLDPLSADCVSCHDGVGASEIGVDLRDRPFGRRPQVDSFTSNHPLGMTYSSYAASGKGYKRIPMGTRMLFVNGKVGCLTCHDPLSPERGRLVMSDRRSALCLTCHDK
jgi:predicted CXXCH cytochrome family protein